MRMTFLISALMSRSHGIRYPHPCRLCNNGDRFFDRSRRTASRGGLQQYRAMFK